MSRTAYEGSIEDVQPDQRPATEPPEGGRGDLQTAERSRFRKWFAQYGWRHLAAWLGLAFAFFPVVYVVSAALNPAAGIANQQLIPPSPSLANFEALLTETLFLRWLWNTIIICGGAAVVTTFLCALAAYAFSRMRFRGRRGSLLFILLAQMFPPTLAVVAVATFALQLQDTFPVIGYGTRLGLFLFYLGTALGVNAWLMKGFFDTLPKDMDESAKVDGASHAQIFFRIILPLARPILAVIFLLTLIATNTDFLISSVLLQNESDYTLAVGLSTFIKGQYGQRWGEFAAGAIMASVWIVAIFMYLQRYLVSGLTQGAVKG